MKVSCYDALPLHAPLVRPYGSDAVRIGQRRRQVYTALCMGVCVCADGEYFIGGQAYISAPCFRGALPFRRQARQGWAMPGLSSRRRHRRRRHFEDISSPIRPTRSVDMLTVPRALHLTERQKDAFTNQGDSGCILEECCKKPWSHISYWECNRHIGHKWLPVLTSALVVLNEEPYPVSAGTAENTSNHAIWSQQGRLCLDRLVRHFTSPRAFSEDPHSSRKKYYPSIPYSSSPTKQRRRLSHEGISLLLLPKGQILLTNKTPTTPIFVASPCFVQQGNLIAGDWPVYRVAPTCSLVVFDARIYEDRLTEACKSTPWPGKSLFGPVLHISLGSLSEPLLTSKVIVSSLLSSIKAAIRVENALFSRNWFYESVESLKEQDCDEKAPIFRTQSSSSEHEDIVELPYDASKESSFSSEEVVIDVPLTFDKSHIKVNPKIEAPFPEDVSIISSKDQDSCSTSNDECVDVVEVLSIRSAKFSDPSNKSSLSPEEVAVDAPQISDRHNSDSYSKTDDSSRLEHDSQKKLLKSISNIEPEVGRGALQTMEKGERTAAGGMTVEDGGEVVESYGTRPNGSPVSNFFLRITDLIEKISEITGHIDNTSKLIALCVLMAAVLIPTTTICLLPTSESSAKTDLASPCAVDSDGSSELTKCRSMLNWRQEKIEQLETKLEKLKSSLRELKSSYDECGRSLTEYQEKYAKCEVSLKKTRKQLKNQDELYESCRNKLLELQEKIIDRQQDDSPDCRPFYQKALDKIFGYHTGRKFRERRSKWRNQG
ncbi:hypothetical protein TcWFU_005181 [Taenia crassiceps]|uniref:Uncharacterized protein n=1 Tax=Taenia crassiceps TaxID=6207 RepID=A0ABR4QL38_9CEST